MCASEELKQKSIEQKRIKAKIAKQINDFFSCVKHRGTLKTSEVHHSKAAHSVPLFEVSLL